MQELHDTALTEPANGHVMMPFSLARLLGMHAAGSIMPVEGRPEPDPAASDLERYQAASAAHWIATYFLATHDPPRVGTTANQS